MSRKKREIVDGDRPQLSAFIHECRDSILAEWEATVRRMPMPRELDRPALIDHLPALLDRIAQMADEIRAGDQPELPTDIAEIHAIERLGEGFDLNQVVAEFSVLRDCIIRLWEERLASHSHMLDVRVLNKAIDRAVSASIDRYTYARDRTMKAMDQLANAALESRTLDDFLQRLLRTLVNTTAALDTATILLRDGDFLEVRASVGLDDEVRRKVRQRIGEGFAGTIAAAMQPLELRHAATDPLIQREAIREAGIRALYGVPLSDGGAVIAVAHMGSRTAHEFSNQDKSLFAAMASRATAAIFQHMLRETAERTAEQLRAREDELSAIADNIPQLTWMADAGGSRYWYNRRWYDYTGLTAEESRGPVVAAAHHPEHLARVLETWQRATVTGQPWQETFPLRGKNGRFRWFLALAVPVHDDHGKVVRWFGTNTDVTAQRCLDEATKLLSSSLDYRASLDQLVKLVVPDLCDWCAIDLVEDGIPRRIASAPADAHPGYADVISAPIAALGRTLGTITLASVDTAFAAELGLRIGMAVENARLYQMSQNAVQSREEILAIVSHDLRNPLASIDLGAASIANEPSASPRTRRQLDMIRRSSTRMAKLIEDLLDMASIQANAMKLQLLHQDPQLLIADVVEAHTAMAAEKGIRLIAECDLSEPVACDRGRIEQVLANLIGNAIKFGRPGDVIFVRVDRHVDQARFSVADTGPGIAPDEIAHLFEAYWSARRPATKTGTGLGLYIAKGIVEAHDGTLWVDSKLGEGARFYFTLPLHGATR